MKGGLGCVFSVYNALFLGMFIKILIIYERFRRGNRRIVGFWIKRFEFVF